MADGVILVNLASVSIPPHMPKEKQTKTNPSPKPSTRTIFFGFKPNKFDLEVIEKQ